MEAARVAPGKGVERINLKGALERKEILCSRAMAGKPRQGK